MMVCCVGLGNDIVLFEQERKITWSGINSQTLLLQETVYLQGVVNC